MITEECMNKNNLALKIHKRLRGKLEINSKISLKTRKNLSLMYTPGVGEAVKYIKNHPEQIFNLTIKNNTIAVITDGSAVLGLGNVGAQAALPVMEGKCAIFKEFSGINAFPICLKTQSAEEIVQCVKNISPVFAAINLEDISAPRCFDIENKLQTLGIPVMHDDQHATAIVVLAGLINAATVVKKDLKLCKTVIAGVGAAGTAVTKLLAFYGLKNIILVDSQGILSSKRQNLEGYKKDLLIITNRENQSGNLIRAVKNADILIGVSQKGIFTKGIIQNLNKNSIVFALANPYPEISKVNANKWGVTVYANGRSDNLNQVNNALVFPGFFKGLIQNKISGITNKMKLKAAIDLASLINKPTSEYFIPSIFDKRVVPAIVESLRRRN